MAVLPMMAAKNQNNNMFRLIDTFNARPLSNHRTLDAAVKAQAKHSRAVSKANGAGSYIPKKIIEVIDGEETEVDSRDIMAAEHRCGIC